MVWTSGGIKNSREKFKWLAGKSGSISNMIWTHPYAHPQHMKIVKPYMCLILMWESSWMILSSSTTLWCDLTLWRKPELKLPSKSLAKEGSSNLVRTCPLAHPQHMKVVQHFICVWYLCGDHLEWVHCLNHCTMLWFAPREVTRILGNLQLQQLVGPQELL